MRENPPPLLVFSSGGDDIGDAIVDGGGSESRRKLARSEVLDVPEWASRGSNFFMATRLDALVWTLGGGGGDAIKFDPCGMFTEIGV